MRAVTFIMSDDLEGAEAGLANGNSAFHKVETIPHSPRFASLEADWSWEVKNDG